MIPVSQELKYMWRRMSSKDTIYSHSFENVLAGDTWLEAIAAKSDKNKFAITEYTHVGVVGANYYLTRKWTGFTREKSIEFIQNWENERLNDRKYILKTNSRFKTRIETEIDANGQKPALVSQDAAVTEAALKKSQPSPKKILLS